MIVISLALVIAAAVSLFIGLFVVTDSLTFIFIAIALCLVSLLLLWLGTRTRRSTAPTAPSAPVYGGGARAGGSSTPARAPERDDDLDELTSPDGGSVVRKTTARDRAATRAAVDADQPPVPPSEETPSSLVGVVAGEGTDAQSTDTDTDAVESTDTDAVEVTPAEERDPSPAASSATATTAKKASTKKSTTRKSTAKKAAAKKSTARKSTARKATVSGAGTTGADARARLATISGVGPAKQDALLSQYGSLEAIRDAPVDDIVANVKGFGQALASRVKDELSS